MIEVLSNQILDRIKAEPELRDGDLRRLSQFVDETVMPYVNFERMTALAVGRAWRTATPEQQQQLMAEFRSLLLRTYAGAVSQVRDHTIRVKPLRAAPEDTDVVVRSEIVASRGEPIQIDYRMEKSNPHWKIYDLNVLGIWLVETYRNQFAQEINARGVDGLIKALADRNRQFAQQGGKS
jgi:phospholipid transport system substrate-binding protein